MIFPGMKLVIADHAVVIVDLGRKITEPADFIILPEVDMDEMRMGNDFSDAGFFRILPWGVPPCEWVPIDQIARQGAEAVVPLMLRFNSPFVSW